VSDADRRHADRVPVGMQARVHAPQGDLDVRVCDLSRSGFRLDLPADALGLDTPPDEAQATRAVAAALHRCFAVSLNHDRLGSLLRRHVDLVRVELPGEPEGMLELCCSFVEPLEEAEVELLEAHLPPSRPVVAAPDPVPPTAAPEPEPSDPPAPNAELLEILARGPLAPARTASLDGPAGGRPRQSYRAFVSAVRADTLQTFRCHTDLVTGVGVRIAIPRHSYGEQPKVAARAFTKRHGAYLDLRISDDEQDVWSGRVRVSGVELPVTRPDVMLVTLAFDRTLALHELRNLGLAQDAA